MYQLGFSREIDSIENICIIFLLDLLGRLTGSEVGESMVVVCKIRGNRSHLCAGEQEDPVAAQPKKRRAAEQDKLRIQHQSKAKGLEAHW